MISTGGITLRVYIVRIYNVCMNVINFMLIAFFMPVFMSSCCDSTGGEVSSNRICIQTNYSRCCEPHFLKNKTTECMY